MATESLILVSDFCDSHGLETGFVFLLEQRGLIQTIQVEQTVYLVPEQLARLEKLVRLHRQLAVHVEDLDIVDELLDRVESLQREVTHLRNRLVFYEYKDR